MDENIGGENLVVKSSEGTPKSTRLVAAGLTVAGALTPKDTVSAVTVDNYDSKTAPVVESTGKTSEEMYSTPGIEEVKNENPPYFSDSLMNVGTVGESNEEEPEIKEIISPEDPRYLELLREIIEAQGRILIESDLVPFEVIDPLGAYDKHGNYYENVINKINMFGNEIEIIAGGYFDEMTFLFDYEDNRVGKMLAFYWLEDKDFGKSFHASPYLEELKGGSEIYIDLRDKGKASYGIITAIGTSASKAITPPELYLDSEGKPKLIGSSPDGFDVIPSGFVRSDKGWIHSILFKGYVQPDGKQVIELLGVIDGSEIIILQEKLDPKSVDLLSKR